MREEELIRIEQGNPASTGETAVLIALVMGVLGLLVFIIWTAF